MGDVLMKENANILDICCGLKAFYFDKNDERVLFQDKRIRPAGFCDFRPNFKIDPDIQMDFRKLQYDDGTFDHVVFDPPHIFAPSEDSIRMTKYYGRLDRETWKQDISKGFSEGFRVLKPGGTLVFKWCDVSVKKKEVIELFKEKPIYGHTTRSKNKTHWLVFYKGRV